ncbi:MAG TPA: Crp/Fnr family transcriptional regulator [Gemmatimonadales bacterium]|jgi:CRP/FNR family transcriptional regulator|nr:Crp/Fnr family transcriptional regulator [Gemmatimonadales bacterium]
MIATDWTRSESFERRLELFSLILRPSAREPHPMVSDHPGCEALSASFRGRLCQQLTDLPHRRLEAGQHLYRVGHQARSLFLVRTGLIKTSRISPAGEELTLRLYKPGDLVGELCLCGGGRREEAIALEPSTVSEISFAALLARLRQDPEAAVELASVVGERLADAYEQIESLSWDTVLYRLVRTLLRLADDLGEPSEAGIRLEHYIRQEELARLVGARREVVSSLLNRLRASGHISYSPRGAITVRPKDLRSFLQARTRAS